MSRLTNEEIIFRLTKIIAEFNKLDEIKNIDYKLYCEIYNKKNCRGVKGIKSLYLYLDCIYGSSFDYSFLFNKMNKEYWTDIRVINILKEFKKNNDYQYGFYKEHYALYVYMRKNKLLNYYLNMADMKIDDLFLKKECNYWQDIDNLKKEYDVLLKLLNGHPTEGDWRVYGISQFPIHYYKGIKNIRKIIDYTIVNNHRFGLDGFKYRSSFEVFTANLLYINNIKYRKDIKVAVNKPCTCDFHLYELNQYIEIWGYRNGKYIIEKEYNKKRVEKEEFYKEEEIKLIKIEACDFTNNFNKNINMIANKLKEYIILKVIPSNLSELTQYERYSIDDLKLDLSPYIYNNRYMPSEVELRKKMRTDIIYHIKCFGGFIKVAELLGLLPNHKMFKERSKIWTRDYKKERIIGVVEKNNLSYAPTLEKIKNKFDSQLGSSIASALEYDEIVNELGLEREVIYNRRVRLIAKKETIKGIFLGLQDNKGYVYNKRNLLETQYSNVVGWFSEFGGYYNLIKEFNCICETDYKRENVSKKRV